MTDRPDHAETSSDSCPDSRGEPTGPRPLRDPKLEIPEVLRQPAPVTRRFHRSRTPRNTSQTARAFGIASEFIFSTLGGLVLGWLVDRWAGTKPWGTLIGLALGFVGGMIRVIQQSNRLDEPSRDE